VTEELPIYRGNLFEVLELGLRVGRSDSAKNHLFSDNDLSSSDLSTMLCHSL